MQWGLGRRGNKRSRLGLHCSTITIIFLKIADGLTEDRHLPCGQAVSKPPAVDLGAFSDDAHAPETLVGSSSKHEAVAGSMPCSQKEKPNKGGLRNKAPLTKVRFTRVCRKSFWDMKLHVEHTKRTTPVPCILTLETTISGAENERIETMKLNE